MALSPPVGTGKRRVVTVVVATLVIAVVSMIGAELTRWTAAVAISLALAGFVAGLLPRLGPLAAAMQMPLLMSFAYSVGQPLSDAAALDARTRGAAGDADLRRRRRARVPGRPAAPAGAGCRAGARLPGGRARARGGRHAGREAEAALVQFRAALARVRDSALPLGGSRDDRAGLRWSARCRRRSSRRNCSTTCRAARAARMAAHAGGRRERRRRCWRATRQRPQPGPRRGGAADRSRRGAAPGHGRRGRGAGARRAATTPSGCSPTRWRRPRPRARC